MKEYETQRKWADKYVGRQLYILAQHFGLKDDELRVSTRDEDLGGVDVYAGPYKIGLRIRKPSPTPRTDFTIRLTRGKTGKHELDKIREGTPDYMLYCTASDATDDAISDWKLIDLAPLRSADLIATVKTRLIDLDDGGMLLAVDIASLTAKYGPVVVASGSGGGTDGR